MSKHSPRMQGNPGGTCPEYGTSFIGKDGQEWERCPVCGHEGRVYIVSNPFLTLQQIAEQAVEALKDKFPFLRALPNEP